MHKVITTSNAPLPASVYSQAIVSDGFVFVAGQAAINPETNLMELGDIRSETERTLKNIQAILIAAGSSLEHVVRFGVFLSDLNDFAAMNEVFRNFFHRGRRLAPQWAYNCRKSRLKSIASRESVNRPRRSGSVSGGQQRYFFPSPTRYRVPTESGRMTA